jgi:hypothetical protein
MFAIHGSWEPLIGLLLLAGLAVLFLSRRRHRSNPQAVKDNTAAMAPVFLVKPYLQLGNNPRLLAMEAVELIWRTEHNNHVWQVQVRNEGESQWRSPISVAGENSDVSHLKDHLLFRVRLDNLLPGRRFEYRILADGATAFGSTGIARHGATQPFTFVAVGDLGKSGGGNMQQIAYVIDMVDPAFIAIAGDVVYERGRVSEYKEDILPVYNADTRASQVGAPLMRSHIIFPAPGNHDVALPNTTSVRDFKQFKDLLAYYIFWAVPLNGPQKLGSPYSPVLQGDDTEAHKRFLKAAGANYPTIGCYSLDWGNLHLTVLDSNAYMNWSDAELRKWVGDDLASARYATWRVVMFHHPGFSSDGKHNHEQRMRLLAPIFERWAVDIVISGHNHCYERSKPLRFKPTDPNVALRLLSEDCPVEGTFELDEKYDGKTETTPHGVIYFVNGAGGAKLYSHSIPEHLQPFTKTYDQSEHSFTHFTVNRRRLVGVQISATGKEIDRFIIEK